MAQTKNVIYKQRNHEVLVGRTVIARMYVNRHGNKELRILQGMPRELTLQKLLTDCPDFCKNYGITSQTSPLLFS